MSSAPTGLLSTLGTSLDGVLILVFAVLAWRAARSRDVAAHRVWARRLFLVVKGVWFLRVGFRAWMVLTGGAFGGTGLGLSIARDVVQAHGGTLTLHNRSEGGLVAELRLPRRR